MSQSQNTATEVRQAGLDKFYTNPDIAQKCIITIGTKYDWAQWSFVIEPSAGNGNFYYSIPVPYNKKVGIDIVPEDDAIIQRDFFDYETVDIPSDILLDKPILVIGNPPFGRVSSLAIKFFNHAAKICDNINGSVIAFIIPRTFRRPSVQNKLNLAYHLVYDEDIPTSPCSFTPNMAVKCCFQIWEMRAIPRVLIAQETHHPDWEFLAMGPLDEHEQPTPPQGADFALRAYGGKCGEIIEQGLETLRPKSWHWIKVNTANITKNELITRFKQLDYSVSTNTARQNSIGRADLVTLYCTTYT
jgi:predicted RNA methylase